MARKKQNLVRLCRQQWALETVPHGVLVILGISAAAIFGAACVQKYIVEAALALTIALLSAYTFTLQTRRFRLSVKLDSSPTKVPLRPPRQMVSHVRPSAPPRVGDSDSAYLAQHAQDVALMLRGDAIGVEGDAFLTSLAKEHLRTMEALRCYEETYGALPCDVDFRRVHDVGEEGWHPIGTACAVVSMPSPAPSPFLDLGALDREVSLDRVVSADAAPTPRSPLALPSPEQQRRSKTSGGVGSSAASFHLWPRDPQDAPEPGVHFASSAAEAEPHAFSDSRIPPAASCEMPQHTAGVSKSVSGADDELRYAQLDVKSGSRRGGS